MLVRCINCGFPCRKYGKTSAGTQRWYCTACHISFVNKIDNTTKQLKEFLTWLFSNTTQQELPGKGRTFRRNTAKFWDIWPMPPKVEERKDIVFVDGIYLARKACVLICYDGLMCLDGMYAAMNMLELGKLCYAVLQVLLWLYPMEVPGLERLCVKYGRLPNFSVAHFMPFAR